MARVPCGVVLSDSYHVIEGTMSNILFSDSFEGSGPLVGHTSDSGFVYTEGDGQLVDGRLRAEYSADADYSDTFLYLLGPALPDVPKVTLVGTFEFDWLNTTTDTLNIEVGFRAPGSEADTYGVFLRAGPSGYNCYAVLPEFGQENVTDGGLGYGSHTFRIEVDTLRSVMNIAIGNVPAGVHEVMLPTVSTLGGLELRVFITTSNEPAIPEQDTYVPKINSLQILLGERGAFWKNITGAAELP